MRLFLRLPALVALFTHEVDPTDEASGGWRYFFDISPSIYDAASVEKFTFDWGDGSAVEEYTPYEMEYSNGLQLDSGERYTDATSYTATLTIVGLFGRESTYSVTFTAGAVGAFSSAFSTAFD